MISFGLYLFPHKNGKGEWHMDVITLICQIIGAVCRIFSATLSTISYFKHNKKK